MDDFRKLSATEIGAIAGGMDVSIAEIQPQVDAGTGGGFGALVPKLVEIVLGELRDQHQHPH